MLQFFFDRNGKFIWIVEAVGLVQLAAIFILKKISIVFLIYFFCYFLIRFCDLFPWYGPSAKREAGIRLHLKKTIVPTAYILSIVNAFVLAGTNALIYPAMFIFAGTLYLNAILIYFHLRDRGIIRSP